MMSIEQIPQLYHLRDVTKRNDSSAGIGSTGAATPNRDGDRPQAAAGRESPEQDLVHIRLVADWCQSFLARPHPQLGRTGSVCPFVPRAIAMDTLAFTVVHTRDASESEVDRVIGRFREVFLDMEPVSGPEAIEKAIMVVLPDVGEEEAPVVIDQTHYRLKPRFVEAGLMIGKFHPRSPQAGLHNTAFRPLRSPIPLLAIRYMVDSDLPFLNRVDDPIPDRIRFLEAYEERFGDGESRWARKGRAALDDIRVPGSEE